MSIPKRIIQTGKNRKGSLMEQAAVANLKLLHPDWEYCFFDDDDVRRFVQSEFPEYWTVFQAFPHAIQRFDFFRYLCVYKLGGFYFDLDVFLAHRLEPLLDSHCVFPFEELTMSDFLRNAYNMDWQLGNYAFGAAAGHPFLGEVIRNCVRVIEDPQWVPPMLQGTPQWLHLRYLAPMTTGPGMLSRTFADHPKIGNDVTVLFPSDVREGKTWHQFGDFGVHLMKGSWRPQDSFLRNRLARMWESRKCRQLFRQSESRGPVRTGSWISRLPSVA